MLKCANSKIFPLSIIISLIGDNHNKGFSLEYYGIISQPKTKAIETHEIALPDTRTVVVNVNVLEIAEAWAGACSVKNWNPENFLKFLHAENIDKGALCSKKLIEEKLKSPKIHSISNNMTIVISKFDEYMVMNVNLEYYNRE